MHLRAVWDFLPELKPYAILMIWSHRHLWQQNFRPAFIRQAGLTTMSVFTLGGKVNLHSAFKQSSMESTGNS